MIQGKELSRDEIRRVWEIDRSETTESVYALVNGALILRPEHHEVRGWPPGQAEKYTPMLEATYDHGGWFYGLVDNQELVGVVVLEGRFMGMSRDQLQLTFLHVSNRYRDQGFGKRLFALAATTARLRGAKRMYISATPSEHTINFYLGLGCKVTLVPDPELFELEPDDIHLEYDLR
jgi:ribosomal protein S18 acetylase RimI-like enzyme